MNISYGLEKLRSWAPSHNIIGPPLLYRRGKGGPSIAPFAPYKNRWIEDEVTGKVYPIVRGGIGAQSDINAMSPYCLLGMPILGSILNGFATFALNLDYVAGTVGNAVAVRGKVMTARTVAALYFWLNSYTGTAANVNDINVEIRADSTYPSPNSAATLATTTVNPSSNTGWIKATISLALTAGTFYWFIVGDADGGTTGSSANISRGGTDAYNTLPATRKNWDTWKTTAGWTNIALESRAAAFIVCFTDGAAVGDVWHTGTTALSTADTTQRGLYIDGLTEELAIYGMGGDVNSTFLGSFTVWENTAGPSGSGWHAQATTDYFGGASPQGMALTAPCLLAKSTPYRFVFKGSTGTNIATPRRLQIGTVATGGSIADLAGAMPGGGKWYYTKENAGSWVDTTTEFPYVEFLVQDQVAVSIPPASGFLATPGMRGGFNG